MFSKLTTVLSALARPLYRRGLYAGMALVMAMGIGLATPMPSQAGLLDLIFHGVRYIQLSNMSERDEVALGSQIDQQLKAQGVQIYQGNPAINEYVNAIGQRLAATSDRPNLPYTFQVVANEDINAFATTGGFVTFKRGCCGPPPMRLNWPEWWPTKLAILQAATSSTGCSKRPWPTALPEPWRFAKIP